MMMLNCKYIFNVVCLYGGLKFGERGVGWILLGLMYKWKNGILDFGVLTQSRLQASVKTVHIN